MSQVTQDVAQRVDVLVRQVLPAMAQRLKNAEAKADQAVADGGKADDRLDTMETQVSQLSDWAQEFSSQHVDHVRKLESQMTDIDDTILPDIEARFKKLEDAVARMMSIVDSVQQQMTGHGLAKEPVKRGRRKKVVEEEPQQEPVVETVEPEVVEEAAEPQPILGTDEPIDTPLNEMPDKPDVVEGITIDSALLSNIDTYLLMGLSKENAKDIADMMNVPQAVIDHVFSLTDEQLGIIRMKF